LPRPRLIRATHQFKKRIFQRTAGRRVNSGILFASMQKTGALPSTGTRMQPIEIKGKLLTVNF
jgi:hypothetical protein